MLTRRHVLGGGCALLVAPGAAWPEAAAPNEEQPAERVATGSDAAELLTVAVRLNGSGPYQFVVDTGADRSVVADDVATSIGPVHGEQVVLRGIVRTLATHTIFVRELGLGAVRRRRLELPIVPRAMLQTDGYLGLDAIDGSRVTFDFKQHVLEIGSARSELWLLVGPDQARVRTVGNSGHLRAIDCAVAGVSASAFIDSGAEVSVGNLPLLRALAERQHSQTDLGPLQLSGITGGEVIGRVTLVDRIKLQDLEFSDCALVIADLPIFEIWGLRDKPALLIGMNYLRQFARVSIDYTLKEIRFDLASLGGVQPA